jgi:hypothetical protein
MTDDRRWLVAFDTDRIKDYILSTPDLRRIRGGSLLLEHLNRATADDINQLAPDLALGDSARTLLRKYAESDEDIVAAGGMAAVVIASKDAANLVLTEMSRLYVTATRIASVSGAVIETTRAELEGRPDGAFERLMGRAALRLREAKDQREPPVEVPLTSFLNPCDACRRHPASVPDDEGEKLVCRACRIKERWGKGRHIFWDEFRAARHWGGEIALPGDFGELGERSSPVGYLGFVCADGNGIGSLMETLPSFREFRRFSIELDKLIRSSTHETIDRLLQRPRRGQAPFEILLMGGDDLMLTVVADVALDLACDLTATFEEQSQRHLGRFASLSAAVVIAHSSFPLKSLHDLGAELLRSAKGGVRPTGKGHVDFMVVTEASTHGVKTLRERVLRRRSPYEDELLTRRPYAAEDLKQLICLARKVKEAIPRHQLETLNESLHRSRFQAQLAGLQARRQGRHRDAWHELLPDLQIDPDLFPWRRGVVDGRITFDTPLVDILEILDFV